MANRKTQAERAAEKAAREADTGGQPVGSGAPQPPPPEIETEGLSRREKRSLRAMADDFKPRLYTVTITDQVRPHGRDEVTLRPGDGYPYLFRRGRYPDRASDEEKAAIKKRRIRTREIEMTPPVARQLAAEGWAIAEAVASDKE